MQRFHVPVCEARTSTHVAHELGVQLHTFLVCTVTALRPPVCIAASMRNLPSACSYFMQNHEAYLSLHCSSGDLSLPSTPLPSSYARKCRHLQSGFLGLLFASKSVLPPVVLALWKTFCLCFRVVFFRFIQKFLHGSPHFPLFFIFLLCLKTWHIPLLLEMS